MRLALRRVRWWLVERQPISLPGVQIPIPLLQTIWKRCIVIFSLDLLPNPRWWCSVQYFWDRYQWGCIFCITLNGTAELWTTFFVGKWSSIRKHNFKNQNVKHGKAHVNSGRLLMIELNSGYLKLNTSTVHQSFTKDLRVRKICDKTVPKNRTIAQTRLIGKTCMVSSWEYYQRWFLQSVINYGFSNTNLRQRVVKSKKGSEKDQRLREQCHRALPITQSVTLDHPCDLIATIDSPYFLLLKLKNILKVIFGLCRTSKRMW